MSEEQWVRGTIRKPRDPRARWVEPKPPTALEIARDVLYVLASLMVGALTPSAWRDTRGHHPSVRAARSALKHALMLDIVLVVLVICLVIWKLRA